MTKKRKKLKQVWSDFLKNLEEEIQIIKKSRENYLYLVTLIILASLLVGSVILGTLNFTKLFDPLLEIYIRNFGQTAIGNFLAVFLICAGFFGFIAFSRIFLESISNEKSDWAKFYIVFFIVTVLFSGTVFIDSIVGAPQNTWMLKDNGGRYIADLWCGDSSKKLIIGHLIECKIINKKLEIKEKTGYALISLHNQTKIEKRLKFQAMKDIDHISVFINATVENENQTIRTGFHPKFYTKEEERDRSKDFLTYFFGLLFISIITMPQLVIKLKKNFSVEKR